MWWSIFHTVSFILVLPHVKCQPSGSFSDRSLKYWFLINSGEGCFFFFPPREWQRLSSSLRRVPREEPPPQPHVPRVAAGVLLPSLPLVHPCPFFGGTNPFLPPPLQRHPVSGSLSLRVSGFASNTLFSLWRNIFNSPGVAAVDNGNLLCFMCLENEFPCQKRRAIITSKRDQIGSLKRK